MTNPVNKELIYCLTTVEICDILLRYQEEYPLSPCGN